MNFMYSAMGEEIIVELKENVESIYTYVIHNNSDMAVDVERVATSCGCARVVGTPLHIPAHGEGHVKVRLTPSLYDNARRIHVVPVLSDESAQHFSKDELRSALNSEILFLKVEPLFDISGDIKKSSIIYFGEEFTTKLVLRNIDKLDIPVVHVISGMKVTTKRAVSGSDVEFTFTGCPKNVGAFNLRVGITDSHATKVILFSVFAKDRVFDKSQLSLGVLLCNEMHTIYMQKSENFKIDSILLSSDNLSVESFEDFGSYVKMNIRGVDTKGLDQGRLVYTIRESLEKTQYSVPYFVLLQKSE